MDEMLLDRDGTAALPVGYVSIETEVEFLRAATALDPVLVRGARLCDWAAAFFRGRQIAHRELVSLTQELKAFCLELTEADSLALVHHLADIADTLERPLLTKNILQALFPAPLWSGSPSVEHAAEWLLWLRQSPSDVYLQPLLAQQTQLWSRQAELAEQAAYEVTTAEDAERRLDDWLGIGARAAFPIVAVFPLEVPAAVGERARRVWRRKTIEGHGQFFDELVNLAIPFKLKQLAAREVGQYYLDKPHELTAARLNQLAHYLGQGEHDQLRRLLAPDKPGPVPDAPAAVLRWFREEYLPYREWQRSHAPAEAQAQALVLQSAREFADWYLVQYPQALTGGSLAKWLSFNKAVELSKQARCVTLIIVLDGLHVADARLLLQGIRQHVTRLEVVSDGLAFAPLPTITEFAKESLMRGVPPGQIKAVEPIGEILPEGKSPAAKLAAAPPQGIYIWRVLEPDRTYHHRNTVENLRQDIEGRLEAEARKIQQIVETVPSDVTLQIVITTDHGRMLGQSRRTLPVPDGMIGHGRAAWGAAHLPFPAEGYLVEGDVAFLYGERYGLNTDVAIPLDESSFLSNDGHTGIEDFPHGGLFPEEVIIPWMTLARDNAPPALEITLIGHGRARKAGTLRLKVMNLGDVAVELRSLSLQVGKGSAREIPIGIVVGQRSQVDWEGELVPWPSAADSQTASVVILCVPPNGVQFMVPAVVTLQSEDLYTARDNILEGLE